MAFVCGTLCLTGCFSINTGTLSSGEEHVVVRNYGWYLFNWLPLGCGNSSATARFPMVMFRDDVTLEKVQDRMIGYAQQRGKTATELVYSTDENVMFTIPFAFIDIPLPYLITYHEVQLSGVLQ